MEPRPLTLVEGWLTDDPAEYHHYRRDAAGWSVGSQLAIDARSWKPWAFWVVGAVGVVWGAALIRGRDFFLGPQLAIFGLCVLGAYGKMLLTIVRGRRRTVFVEARILFDRRHPLLHEMLAGSFEVPERSLTAAATLPEWAVEQLKGPDGALRVLVAWDDQAEYSPVIGIRPREGDGSQNPAQSRS